MERLLPSSLHGVSGECTYVQDGKHIHRSVECLDLGRGAWALLSAQLPSERKYHSVCELGGTVAY